MSRAASLARVLASRQLSCGGWSYFHSAQSSVEATTLAALALGPEMPRIAEPAVDHLRKLQRPDGSWPVFSTDPEGSWTTPLVLCALNISNDASSARPKAFEWLLRQRGREGYWFWRWRYQTIDRNVRFNPQWYGWAWTAGTTSWVIPTSLALIALQQFTVCERSDAARERIRLGTAMLLDRACIRGGWNAGNSLVYGFPLSAHVEPTCVALLALQSNERSEPVDKALQFIAQQVGLTRSIAALAWSILTLFVYQRPIDPLKRKLLTLLEDPDRIQNNATLAMALLALDCGETIHPFEVLT